MSMVGRASTISMSAPRTMVPATSTRRRNGARKPVSGNSTAESIFPVSVIQPTIIYGPYAPWTLHTCSQLLKGTVALPACGEGCCNAVYVDDVVDSIFLAATKDEAIGETFLISGDEHLSWKEWFARHAAVLGVNSALCVPAVEFDRMTARERRKQNLIPAIKSALAEGTVSDLAIRIMQTRLGRIAVKGSIRMVGDLLFAIPGCGHWDSTAKQGVRYLRARANLQSATFGVAPVALPGDSWEASLYASPARVSVTKARRLLGYEPRHNLEQGMRLTSDFIRWAVLA